MTPEHRIPSGLFLRAGRRVEEALRRDTAEAIAQFKRDGDLIATWEDDKIVLLHGPAASDAGLRPSDAVKTDASAAVHFPREDHTPFLELVVGVSQKIYLSGENLHLEFPQGEIEIRDFLSRPENQDVLRDVCRELTGREMAVHLTPAEELQTGGPHVNQRRDVTKLLRVLMAELRAAGESLRERQVLGLLLRRILRQQRYLPHPLLTRPSGVLAKRSMTRSMAREVTREENDPPGREITREEGELLPSHKSKE